MRDQGDEVGRRRSSRETLRVWPGFFPFWDYPQAGKPYVVVRAFSGLQPISSRRAPGFTGGLGKAARGLSREKAVAGKDSLQERTDQVTQSKVHIQLAGCHWKHRGHSNTRDIHTVRRWEVSEVELELA